MNENLTRAQGCTPSQGRGQNASGSNETSAALQFVCLAITERGVSRCLIATGAHALLEFLASAGRNPRRRPDRQVQRFGPGRA